jgi:hypothetical protein
MSQQFFMYSSALSTEVCVKELWPQDYLFVLMISRPKTMMLKDERQKSAKAGDTPGSCANLRKLAFFLINLLPHF